MTDIVEMFVVNDDCSRMGISKFRDSVFIAIHDEYDYHARTSFTKIQVERIIDTLTALKENMV